MLVPTLCVGMPQRTLRVRLRMGRGTIIGGVLGVIAALNVSQIVGWIERVSGQHIFSSDVYFVSNLPSELQGGDVLLICSAGFILSFLATVYPAWRAAKIEPAHALRYS